MEPMHDEISLIDETLNIHSGENYHLSIQVSLDGFSFSILNDINNKYIFFKYLPIDPNLQPKLRYEKIENILNGEEILKQSPYKSVKCMYLSRKNIQVPKDYFDEQYIKTYYESTFTLEELEELHYNEIRELNFMSVFSFPNQISNLILNRFKNATFYHHTTPLFNRIMPAIKTDGETLLLFLGSSFMNVFILKNNALLLENSFAYRNHMDIAYYCMACIQQLKVNTHQLQVLIQGDVKISNELTSVLEQYIPKMEFLKRPADHLYSYTFYRLPSYRFANLLSLPLCG